MEWYSDLHPTTREWYNDLALDTFYVSSLRMCEQDCRLHWESLREMREFSEGTNGTGGFIHFFAVSIVVLGTFWFFVFYDIVIMLRFVTQMWTFEHFTRLRPAVPLGLVADKTRSTLTAGSGEQCDNPPHIFQRRPQEAPQIRSTHLLRSKAKKREWTQEASCMIRQWLTGLGTGGELDPRRVDVRSRLFLLFRCMCNLLTTSLWVNSV